MAKLIKGENHVECLQNTNVEKAGLNIDNCEIVFTADQPYKSWQPGRKIQQIKKFEVGKSYLIRLKKPINNTKKFALKNGAL